MANSGSLDESSEQPDTLSGDAPYLLDGSDQDEFLQVREWWRQERERQAENRYEMAIDAEFADDKQFTEEEERILMERGQVPIMHNMVKPAVEWIIGTQKRTRMDATVYARDSSEEAADAAAAKTKLLKYNADINKTAYSISRGFRDAVTVGVGWLEDGVRGDDTDEPVFSRRESWRNIWYDSLATENDLSDARYIFRQKYVDLDIAKAKFPESSALLQQCATYTGNHDDMEDDYLPQSYQRYDSYGRSIVNGGMDGVSPNNRRHRVRLVECWYRAPKAVKKMRAYEGILNGMDYDENDPMHTEAMENDIVSLYDAIEMRIRCVIFCRNYPLQQIDSPYRHNRFPFTPIWAYRRDRDNAPYGVVRNMRDPQRDYNARMSKALFLLSSRQIIAEASAAEDWDEIRDEAARPDGIMKVKRDARFDFIGDNKQFAEEHLKLLELDSNHLQQASGVTAENMGHESNAQSGRAIIAKQQEGSVVTFTLFDSLRHSMQLQGELQLSLLEQFYRDPKTIRTIGGNSKADFSEINQLEYNEETGEYVFKNDITSFLSDLVIDTSDFRQTVRQAQFEAMMNMMSQMNPEIGMQMLDLAIEMSDIENKDEWVRRIREINGHRGDDDEITPEQAQQLAAQEQEQQKQAQLVEAEQNAKIEELNAKAEKLRADTTKSKLEALEKAVESAATMATMPAVVPIADSLAESAGYEDKTDIGAIDIPRETPEIDPEAQAQAKEHKSPAPQLDPTQAHGVETNAQLEREKLAHQSQESEASRQHQSNEAEAGRKHADKTADAARKHEAKQSKTTKDKK